MKYMVMWSTDYGEEYDTCGCDIIEAESKEEAERKAAIPRHSIINWVREIKQ